MLESGGPLQRKLNFRLRTAAMKITTINNRTKKFITFISTVVKKCPVICPKFPHGNIVLQNCFSSCFHKLSQKKVSSVYYLTIIVCNGGQKEFFMSCDLYFVMLFVKSSEKLKKHCLWGGFPSCRDENFWIFFALIYLYLTPTLHTHAFHFFLFQTTILQKFFENLFPYGNTWWIMVNSEKTKEGKNLPGLGVLTPLRSSCRHFPE